MGSFSDTRPLVTQFLPHQYHDAFQDFLITEPAYAAELTQITEIYIPIVKGQKMSRVLQSTTVSRIDSRLMRIAEDDVRIIFGNVGELICFATSFADKVHLAIDDGENGLGALFVQEVPIFAIFVMHPQF